MFGICCLFFIFVRILFVSFFHGNNVKFKPECTAFAECTANAGNNDPVYAWSEMTDGNQSTVVSQMWIVQNNAKGLIVKPASNQSLSLNVYRSGNWPCTVYSISDNSYEDYILNSPSYGNNLCQFRLTYRNNYALTASNTSAPQKFSRGSGYIATWTSSSGANSQKWYYTTPN